MAWARAVRLVAWGELVGIDILCFSAAGGVQVCEYMVGDGRVRLAGVSSTGSSAKVPGECHSWVPVCVMHSFLF
jgi:hypothetical protein